MSKLFSAFNAATKKEWIKKITTDLKGADYNEKLVSDAQGIEIAPIYHANDNTPIFNSSFPDNYPNENNPDPFAITIGRIISETCQGNVTNFSMALTDPDNPGTALASNMGNIPDNCYGNALSFVNETIKQTNAYGDVIKKASDLEIIALSKAISEVAKILNLKSNKKGELPTHIIRFWETKFIQIKPIKRGGGRRYYRPEDVDLLKGIKNLLYNDGYTIRGVQKVIKENGSKNVLFSNNKANTKLSQKAFTDSENSYISEQNVHTRTGQSLSDNKRKKLMDVMQNLVELQSKISSK